MAINIVNVSLINGKTIGVALGDTADTAVLTNSDSPEAVYKVNSIVAANVDGTTSADVNVDFYDGTTAFSVASAVTVPPKNSVVLVDKNSSLYLETSDAIRAWASATGDIEITISYEVIK